MLMLVNGKAVTVLDHSQRLLDFLRDNLGLIGVKEGCGMGECGACTVLVRGEPVCSCLVLVGQVDETEIITIEGLGPETLHPVQQAVIEAHASQCGFCTPGVVLSLAALLAREPNPEDESVRNVLAGNLCRCTGFGQIFEAARQALAP
jgi:carbon-monoxide dehydrogenase small subunit